MATGDAGPAQAAELSLADAMADADNNLGNTLARQKRYEHAAACYQRAVALRPDMADAHVNLAKAYEALERVPEALTEYRTAVTLRPYHFDTYRRLGALFYGWNRIDEAAAVYRKWLSLEPESPVARHLLSACTGHQVPVRASDDNGRTMFQGFAESVREVPARLQ